jgi:cardiolipin synthase
MSLPRTSRGSTGSAGSFVLPWRIQEDIESAVRRVFAPEIVPAGRAARPPLSPAAWQALWLRWSRTLVSLRPLGGVSLGNQVQVFSDGDRAFEAMWDAIASAARCVLTTTYILAPDDVGRRTLDLLEHAARRGCEVVFVYDAFGSHELPASWLEPLRAAGARLHAFNPLLRLGLPFLRLERNHRKILVVDDRIGFCGGMNVAREYAGPRHGSGMFRDTHVAVTGPCVRHLAALVLDLARTGPHRHSALAKREALSDQGTLVQVLESNVRRRRMAIQKALRVVLARAQERAFLTSPYFVPPPRLVRSLRNTAARGVDVRVLTAGRSDVPLVRLASQHLYGRLLKSGVRIWEMQGRTLHAKTAAVDGVWSSVGSFNLDFWSHRRNLEVNLAVLDRATAKTLEGEFEQDLALSREVKLAEWERRTLGQRLLHWMAYQVLSF